MKSHSLKGIAEQVVNAMIVVLVVLGTAAFAVVNQVPEGGALMSKLFLVFLGAIITIQIIPGLILLGAMIKGIARLGRKEQVPAESEADHGKE